MIRRKSTPAEAGTQPKKPRRPSSKLPKGPLEVRVTMRFKFGNEPDDVITMMDDRAVPMVDSVFRNRDRIVRNFVRLLMKAGLAQPRVAREIFPMMKLLKRSGS